MERGRETKERGPGETEVEDNFGCFHLIERGGDSKEGENGNGRVGMEASCDSTLGIVGVGLA